MSSFGSSGFGASRMGGLGMGGMSTFGGSRFGSGLGGMSTFGSSLGGGMYGGQGGGQAFVGRDGADMANVFNQMGRAGTQFFNQMNRNMGGRGGRNRNREANQSEEQAPSDVRVELNVDFNHPRPTTESVVNQVRARLAGISAGNEATQLIVTQEDGVIVLRGVAADANQRRVFEHLIALEPGVRAVRNEMTVAEPPQQ
jgi:hypothetical protein